MAMVWAALMPVCVLALAAGVDAALAAAVWLRPLRRARNWVAPLAICAALGAVFGYGAGPGLTSWGVSADAGSAIGILLVLLALAAVWLRARGCPPARCLLAAAAGAALCLAGGGWWTAAGMATAAGAAAWPALRRGALAARPTARAAMARPAPPSLSSLTWLPLEIGCLMALGRHIVTHAAIQPGHPTAFLLVVVAVVVLLGFAVGCAGSLILRRRARGGRRRAAWRDFLPPWARRVPRRPPMAWMRWGAILASLSLGAAGVPFAIYLEAAAVVTLAAAALPLRRTPGFRLLTMASARGLPPLPLGTALVLALAACAQLGRPWVAACIGVAVATALLTGFAQEWMVRTRCRRWRTLRGPRPADAASAAGGAWQSERTWSGVWLGCAALFMLGLGVWPHLILTWFD